MTLKHAFLLWLILGLLANTACSERSDGLNAPPAPSDSLGPGDSPVDTIATPPDSTDAPPDSLPPPALHPGRGNFRHIDVLSYTRALNFNVPSGERQNVEAWLAHHVDVNEGDLGIKDTNPAVEIFKYELDLTASTPSNFTLPAGEEAYLHFAEDTVIQYRDLAGNDLGAPVTIPGSPADGPPTAASRVKLYMWESYRYAFDPSDPEFRSWQTGRLLADTDGGYDGVVLDEHSPGFKWGLYLRQNRILSGGAVREVDGLRPSGANLPGKPYNALDAGYSALVADWLADLHDAMAAEGRFVLINPAQYYWVDLSENEYTAAGGVSLEFVHVPFDWSSGGYANFAAQVRRAVDAGVMVDLFGRWCTTGGGGYPPGDYASGPDRYRMWRLASYYFLRGAPDAPGVVYFDPSFCNENASLADYQAEWEPAYEYDFGDPEGDGYVIREGSTGCGDYKVFARDYTYGMVLVRPQDGTSCTDYGDGTAVDVPLPRPLRMLSADGSLGDPVSSVRLRNAEAVVLIDPGR